MVRVTVAQAAAELQIPVTAVRYLIEKGKGLPGYDTRFIKGKKKSTFFIWRKGEKEDDVPSEMRP